jgi:hypothetical protein
MVGLALAASGQGYSLSTNVWFTNNIEASATLSYTGTNYLDVSRYQTFALVATGVGTNISTNSISFTFLASPTGTNWPVAPTYTLTGTANGTNPFYFYTNLTCGDGVGFVKSAQIISSVTNRITNAWVWGALKTFPRN